MVWDRNVGGKWNTQNACWQVDSVGVYDGEVFELLELPYAYGSLEPYIDSATMQVHHTKHHAAYVKNLNDALVGVDVPSGGGVEELILHLDRLPQEVRVKVRNNGGGHYNHSLFWESMASVGKGGEASGRFHEWLAKYGGMGEFKKHFTAEAMGVFGSGWAWFVRGVDGEFGFVKTPNQDCPLMLPGAPKVILGLDVWEHAYYLRYQNRRADYIDAWWNVVNWKKVSERFEEALGN